MQILEFLVLLSSTVVLFFGQFLKPKVNQKYLTSSLLIMLFIHLILEGYRWQMIPTYLLWVFALWSSLSHVASRSTPMIIIRTFPIIILCILSYFLAATLPVFHLPKPTGKYTVGTQDIHLKLNREEIITENKNDHREFMIKVWYPSQEQSGKRDKYVDKAGRTGFAVKYGLPAFTMNYLDYIKTYVYQNISIAKGAFPVLVFSHGYHSKANGYYSLLTEIASQGYIIFAINHTYESTGATFPDGSFKFFDVEHAHKIAINSWEGIKPTVEAFKKGFSFEKRHPIVKKDLLNYFVRDMEEYWAQDISDVITALDQWNKSGFFKDHLNTKNIGVFGHSRGGGSAGEALLTDARIRAAANIDGVQWGKIVDTSFQKPFLFISSDWPTEHQDLNSHAYINKSTSIFYEAKILASGHSNFMDIPYMVKLNALTGAGNIDPRLATDITNQLVIAFFDKHLKGAHVNIKQLSKKYQALELKVFEGKE